MELRQIIIVPMGREDLLKPFQEWARDLETPNPAEPVISGDRLKLEMFSLPEEMILELDALINATGRFKWTTPSTAEYMEEEQ